MASTYSNLKIQLMATGENSATWGNVTNLNLGTAIEEAITGSVSVAFSGGNVTLSLTDTNTSQSARNLRLNLTGTGGYSLIVPSISKAYIINNGTDGTITVKNATGTGIAVPTGKTMWVFNNGVNVVDVVTHLTTLTLGSALPLTSGGTGSNTGSGASLTNLNGSNVSSGMIAVTYGGTGGTTAATARVSLLPSYTGNNGKILALNAGATDVEWISAGGAGTVTSVNASTSLSGLSFSGGPVTSSGTLALSGTLGVASGGTGSTTLTSGAVLIGAGTSAVSSVSPGTAGNVLTSNGSTWVSQVGGGGGSGTVTSVSGSGGTTGLTLSGGPITTTGTLTLGGTLIAANGGTGLATPGTVGNVLTSTGSAWISSAVSGSGTFSAEDGLATAPSIYFTNSNTTGFYRVAADQLGITAGGSRVAWLTNGSTGIAIGQGALASQTSGTQNVVVGTYSAGFAAGGSITSGGANSCFGHLSGYAVSVGNGNTAVGAQSLYAATNKLTGNYNTGIGYQTYATILSSTFSGANTTCLGYAANPSSATVSNEITLGNASIATLRCQVTTITSLSDARDKANIVGLNAGLDFVNALNPVRFTWNMRPTKGPDGEDIQGRVGDEDTGFIAQELKAAQATTGIVIPGLVYESNPESIEAGYGKLLPVLVKAIQELSAKVEALEAQLGG
jgi:hypothetical protein